LFGLVSGCDLPLQQAVSAVQHASTASRKTRDRIEPTALTIFEL
jgi:hypothetical protein